ncbi:MAG: DUF456 family protein [Chthoniobacterales bacterium]|nr:DUF456 family protein [Chthoniobacterales bacterium]
MDLVWWFVAVVVMAIGLIGTVLPIVPGTTIILGAAIGHRLLAGPEDGVGWWALGVLVLLTALSYAVDFLAGYVGAKRFGASRWGVAGAVVGGIVGIFTGFITLLVLPIVGAIIGELIAGKRLVAAGKAGWGTLLGNLAGIIGKLAIALAMIVLFIMNTHSPAFR